MWRSFVPADVKQDATPDTLGTAFTDIEQGIVSDTSDSSDGPEAKTILIIQGKEYRSPLGYSIQFPTDASVTEAPAAYSMAAATHVSGDFGTLCISPGYGCGGVGLQGWSLTKKEITTASGNVLTVFIYTRDTGAIVTIVSLDPLPASPWTKDAQLQVATTLEHLAGVESMLASLSFR